MLEHKECDDSHAKFGASPITFRRIPRCRRLYENAKPRCASRLSGSGAVKRDIFKIFDQLQPFCQDGRAYADGFSGEPPFAIRSSICERC
jgi:hypothetical protein